MSVFTMKLTGRVVLLCCALAKASELTKTRNDVRKFPDGFMFGTATASHQVEGAWNKDGKSENIWDHMTHTQSCITKDCSNADVADDSYHQYKRDVEMMRELGLDFYRFSLSWPRLLPSGFSDRINEAGVQYYNNLINEMLKFNIEPMVTLYHWDLPQRLQDLGGWTNPYVIEWFGDFARAAFEQFGDRVKYWITINEPREICYQGYGATEKAPILNITGIADYLCAKNLLLAHARAYHIYDDEFRAKYGGTIGITFSAKWYEPETDSEIDIQAAEEQNHFEWNEYVHPVYSETGDFPLIMKEKIAAKSTEQGFPRSRLPEFTQEEINYVRGTSDFFGLNHYTTYLVYRNESVYGTRPVPSFYDDLDTGYYQPADWESSASAWLKVVPWGLYKILTKIRETYNNPPVYITENGLSTRGGIQDDDRVRYYRSYLSAMLDAIDEGSDVRAYTAWSLMDNFEWMQGYMSVSVCTRWTTRARSARARRASPPSSTSRSCARDSSTPPTSPTPIIFLFLSCILSLTVDGKSTRQDVRKFPDGFLFGTATASYQVEGAWNEDGKSESIWDTMTHTHPEAMVDYTNGDVAVDSYHLYERDVEMMRELGLDFYRFSLSWTRILPSGFADRVNEAGVAYYNKLINEMLKYNIEPMVTIYHWDLPQRLQDLGGWTNPHIVDWYSDYARVAFEQFGDRVKYWVTINEPKETCYHGYGSTSVAPMLNDSGIADYLCAKNLLVAHAKAYHIYNNEFKSKWGGQVGIAFSATWHEPASDSPVDIQAAEEQGYFEWAQYTHPVYSTTGDFPQVMKDKVAAKSAQQGYPRSRLPEFTPEEIASIRGSSDFFGLNHYTTNFVYRNESVYGINPVPSLYDDLDTGAYQDPEWDGSATSWLKVVPWGFYKLLTKIRVLYNNPPVLITENGFSTYLGLQDDDRIRYYRAYLSALLDAVDEGSDVRAYAAWTLMDNFEWRAGLKERFGLYEVDMESPEFTRTPRKSAFVYKEIIRSRQLDPAYEPDTYVMTIDEGH